MSELFVGELTMMGVQIRQTETVLWDYSMKKCEVVVLGPFPPCPFHETPEMRKSMAIDVIKAQP